MSSKESLIEVQKVWSFLKSKEIIICHVGREIIGKNSVSQGGQN
jgi:hypothetical protein